MVLLLHILAEFPDIFHNHFKQVGMGYACRQNSCDWMLFLKPAV